MPRRNLGPDVYNVWLDQSQDYGQNRSTASVFFRGRIIYSYGTHFPMGVLHRRANGAPWVLLNGDTYSSTTGRHQAGLRSACQSRRVPTLTVPFTLLRRLGLPHTIEGTLEPEAVAATLVARQDHARVA